MRRPVTLPLSDVVRDERLRFRDRFHSIIGVREQYADAMREAGGWGEFPPALCVELTAPHSFGRERVNDRGVGEFVTETYPAGTAVLVGGFTRCAAAEAAGVAEVPAELEPGTWDDALKLAWSQNSRHGKPRSADELRAVLASIHQDDKYSALAERAVAELAGCSRASVNRYRRDLDEAAESRGGPAASSAAKPAKIDATTFTLSLKDRWGRPVPAHLRPAFEAGPDLDRFAARIRDVAKGVAVLKHGPDGRDACAAPGLLLLDAKRLAAGLLTLANEVDERCPWIVCPTCAGPGCPKCGDRGWLPRRDVADLSAPLERKARSFAAAHLV